MNLMINWQMPGLPNWLQKKVYQDTGLVFMIKDLKTNLSMTVLVNLSVSIGGLEINPTIRKITVMEMKTVFMHKMEMENGKIFVVRKNNPMSVRNQLVSIKENGTIWKNQFNKHYASLSKNILTNSFLI